MVQVNGKVSTAGGGGVPPAGGGGEGREVAAGCIASLIYALLLGAVILVTSLALGWIAITAVGAFGYQVEDSWVSRFCVGALGVIGLGAWRRA